jgi:ornithine cyclodeaminase/alanine dehydrogenase-like protein (mu-crystallin family)
MRFAGAAEIDAALDFPSLIDALAAAFRGDWTAPPRHHHTIAGGTAPDATLLLMPAWTDAAPGGGFIGTKIVSVFPGNSARRLPAVSGLYLLLDGATGAPALILDGSRLTLWRTAAASALAARSLARVETGRMAMVGAGALAPFLVRAHASVRPIRQVLVWNRTGEAAERLAAELCADGFAATATTDLEAAVRGADLVSCATLSPTPLVHGAWLQPGCHLDLVGAFTPKTREADDEAVRRASVFVDTRAGGLTEAGDIVLPLASGAIARDQVRGDLFDLCRGAVPGRKSASEITLFKSVGTALEDLAAAILVFQAGCFSAEASADCEAPASRS